ncbi:MAG: hypothetical protein F4X26_06095 [Chloroflexi bacterium]|nr:hypothetical protein [Chloroflexota bacterium]MYD65536.1 hypothetical protein [Chloroflexota bacterium]
MEVVDNDCVWWMFTEGEGRVAQGRQVKPFQSPEDLEAFFRKSNANAGPGREPDWEEHLAVMRASQLRGTLDD